MQALPIQVDETLRYESVEDNRAIFNFVGKDVIYLNAQEGWGIERISQYEAQMNKREWLSGSNVRYRVFPYGVNIHNPPTQQVFMEKVIVRCAYCGRYGARYCECLGCGQVIA